MWVDSKNWIIIERLQQKIKKFTGIANRDSPAIMGNHLHAPPDRGAGKPTVPPLPQSPGRPAWRSALELALFTDLSSHANAPDHPIRAHYKGIEILSPSFSRFSPSKTGYYGPGPGHLVFLRQRNVFQVWGDAGQWGDLGSHPWMPWKRESGTLRLWGVLSPIPSAPGSFQVRVFKNLPDWLVNQRSRHARSRKGRPSRPGSTGRFRSWNKSRARGGSGLIPETAGVLRSYRGTRVRIPGSWK